MDVEILRYRFKDGDNQKIKNVRACGWRPGVRHLQMLYMCLCSCVVGAVRGGGAVALQAMSVHTRDRINYTDTTEQFHEWDSRVQGTILSSFLFGHALMLLPAELFLHRMGGKVLVTGVLLVNGSLAAALPTIANKGGWIGVCNAEFILGMTQSCVAPAHEVMLARWFPPWERKLFSYIVYGGLQLGTIIALPVFGMMSEARRGWELIFYTQAMMTLSMAAMWGLLTASTPDRHQAIGDTEKEYIKEATSQLQKRAESPPWRHMCQSPNFWALASAHAASNALYIFFLFEVPAYLRIFTSLKNASVASSLPFVAMWIVYSTTAPSINWAHKTECISYILSLTHFRKIINAMGGAGVTAGLITLYYLGPTSGNVAVFVLVATLGLLGFQFSGFLENHKDFSHNFSGTVLVISNFFASVVGAAVPLVTGLILGDQMGDIQRWKTVLLYLSSFYIIGNLIYTLLGSSKKQDWEYNVIRQNYNGYHNGAHNLELEELSNLENTQSKQ